MRFRKIAYVLSIALALSSLPVNAHAETQNPMLRGILGDTVIIDKGESNGDNILLPEDVLGNISSWGDGASNNSTTSQEEVISHKGSIKISLSDMGGKNDKSNVKFALSKVAEIKDGEYKLLDDYKSSGVELNDLSSSNDLEIAANLLQKVAKADSTLVTNSEGKCEAKDLEVGVYLLYATDIANYENITPFLISIPVWDESSKSMSYDVEVIPKHTPIPVKEVEKPKAPATGYNSKAITYAGIAGVSFILASTLLVLNNRKKIKKCR